MQTGQAVPPSAAVRTLIAETDKLGECPTWDAQAKRFCWVDVVGKRISSCQPDGSDLRREAVDDFPGSFAPRERGGRIVAFRRRIALFDAAGAEEKSSALAPEAITRERFNDGATDSRGRFFVGTMDPRLTERSGGLYRVDHDLSIHRLTDGIGLGNGIAWSPDDKLLYHCDSSPPIVYVHDFDVETGRVSNRRVFATLDPAQGKPDGCAVDVEGFLWMAAPGSGTVLRFDPDGRIAERLAVPVKYPSSVCFGGDDLKTLYITSLQHPEGPADPRNGAVFAVGLAVAGLPCARFGG